MSARLNQLPTAYCEHLTNNFAKYYKETSINHNPTKKNQLPATATKSFGNDTARDIERCLVNGTIDSLPQPTTTNGTTQMIQTQKICSYEYLLTNHQSEANIAGECECVSNSQNSIDESLRLGGTSGTALKAAACPTPTRRSATMAATLSTRLVMRGEKKRAAPVVPKAHIFSTSLDVTYDLYVTKRLKLSDVTVDTLRLHEGVNNCVYMANERLQQAATTAENSYNRSRRHSYKNNVGNDDGPDRDRSSGCVCVSECSQEQSLLNIKSDKWRMPNSFRLLQQKLRAIARHWPSIVGIALKVRPTPTAAPLTWRSKVSAWLLGTRAFCASTKAAVAAETTTKTICAAELLEQQGILKSLITSTTTEQTMAPPQITTAATKMKLTATNGLLSLVRYACLVVALFFTLLTLQHATTTATFVTKTTNTMTSVATIMPITTQPVSAIMTLEISQIARYSDRRTNRSERLIKKLVSQQLPKKHQQQHTRYVGTQVAFVSSQRRDPAHVFTDGKGHAEIMRTSQKDAIVNGRGIKQYIVHQASQAAVEMPKIEDAYTRNNSLIPNSKLAYDKLNIGYLFNERPVTGWPQQTVKTTTVTAPTSVAADLSGTLSQHSGAANFHTNSKQQLNSTVYKLESVRTGSYEAAMSKFQHLYDDEGAVRGVFSVTGKVENKALDDVNGDTKPKNSMTASESFKIDNVYMNMQSSLFKNNEENKKLLQLVMDGLRLQKLPNMKKVNISQTEYVTKYREYLLRVHERKRRELAELAYRFQEPLDWGMENVSIHILSIATNATEFEQYSRRKRNILNNSDEDDYADDDAVTEGAKATDHFILPRKQRNNDGRTRRRQKGKTTMVLRFALPTNPAQMQAGDVEEANIRLMLIHSSALSAKSNKQRNKSRNRACDGNSTKHGKQHVPTKQKHVLNLKVYQRLRHGKRIWLDGCKVDIEVDPSRADDTHSQWLQFDVTKAVEAWLREEQSNLGIEVQCDNCQRVGARILNDMSSPTNSEEIDVDEAQLLPVLNIIGRLGLTYKEMRSNKHSNSAEAAIHHHHNAATLPNERERPKAALDKHTCHKSNQRCCRHTMEVVFKEIKGFEFIIQPKVFDAGYCHGRCPPRYNPAHHHAMLQSLIWKQNRQHAPRPCCAPSKLVELEVLHVDEKDSEKLKISTWTDMRVIECACS